MGFFLLDLLTPWRRDRLQSVSCGSRRAPRLHGTCRSRLVLAQLRRRVDRALARFDPLLGWLAVDGYGFHQGYFRWPDDGGAPAGSAPALGLRARVFDQGLGRSLWFVEGAEVRPHRHDDRPVSRRSRHADLWSGVGLACAYAGGVARAAIEALDRWRRCTPAPFRSGRRLRRQGARAWPAIPRPHTNLACRIVCGMAAEDAARLTDRALVDLPADGDAPAYEVWRSASRPAGSVSTRCVDWCSPHSAFSHSLPQRSEGDFDENLCTRSSFMTVPERLIRRHAARLVALAIIVALYGLSRAARLSGTEQARLAGRFHFARHPLPELAGDLSRTVRPVHPSLKRIESWISSVGAAVALNDLDGDGLPNDVVYVDPRSDRVIVAPVPGTGERYQPFSLDRGAVALRSRHDGPHGLSTGRPE